MQALKDFVMYIEGFLITVIAKETYSVCCRPMEEVIWIAKKDIEYDPKRLIVLGKTNCLLLFFPLNPVMEMS